MILRVRDLVFFIALFAAFGARTSNGLIVTGYDAELHDRGLGDSSFIGSTFDFSGVGRSGGQWATMISDQFFLSATHSHPSSSVTFYHPNGTTTATINVVGGSAIPNDRRRVAGLIVPGGVQTGGTTPSDTDLWVGQLATAVPSWVATYPLGALTMQGENVFVAGNCPNSLGSETCVTSPQEFVLGTNDLDSVGNAITTAGSSTFGSIGAFYTRSTTASDTGDTRFEGGDSGGPTFVSRGGALELVGIHSGVAPAQSVDVAVQAYASEINAIAVPEPSSFIFLSAVFLLIAGSKRFSTRVV